jgi:hypothetical protein
MVFRSAPPALALWIDDLCRCCFVSPRVSWLTVWHPVFSFRWRSHLPSLLPHRNHFNLTGKGKIMAQEIRKKIADQAGIEEALAPAIEKITKDFSRQFRRRPQLFWWLLGAILLLIVSPIFSFWLDFADRKEWSEIVKNVVEALAVVAGAFAIVQWVTERGDRATDILFQLADKFQKVNAGKQLIDDSEKYRDKAAPKLKRSVEEGVFEDPIGEIDQFLDFYILLHAVRHARQVPDAPLSVCFRYWLAYYFHRERKEFRNYVDKFYPTLARWLQEDCQQGLPFFRPHRLFKDKVDDEVIKQCCESALR